MSWLRVNKARPCKGCGKEDWCLVSEDGSTGICMRAVSDRPFEFKSGEVGYFHKFSNSPQRVYTAPRIREPEPVVNVGALIREWSLSTKRSMLVAEAQHLGVDSEALYLFGWAWAPPHNAWAIPMRNGVNDYTGIRLRRPSGAKFAVRGSHQGIFVPQTQAGRTLLVCEGPTDAAAGFSLGFWTIGRPSCSGGIHDIRTMINRVGINRVVIVSDNDDEQEVDKGRNPGVNGSMMLSKHLPVMHQILVLPAKDLRAFLNMGGTKQLLDCIINENTWIKPICDTQKT